MAGVGIRLNRIFNRRSLLSKLVGFGYSTVLTIAPMLVMIIVIILMQLCLGYGKLDYATREVYASTVLYIFIFSMITESPFSAVISRYLSDTIYEERFADIMPCYYTGLIMNLALSLTLGIPFCIHEYIVGEVDILFVLLGYCGYVCLVVVFHTMLFLNICKDYKKISLFFIIGLTLTFLLSLLFVYVFGMGVTYAMMLALDIGMFIIATLEYAVLKSYFKENSRRYSGVLSYFRKYWQLVVTNFLYSLGLYIHNFVLWSTDLHMIVAKSFVCVPNYDLATCIAMFTNISSSVIFLTRVEMNFHDRYRRYSESVIGGRRSDIDKAQNRMFRQLTEELMNLVRIQFIISTAIFLLANIILPRFGFGGYVMQMYPCLAAGYYILFTMYAAIVFLYYFNDLTGALLTSFSFCLVTFLGTLLSVKLSPMFYGLGFVVGSFVGFGVSYFRLRKMEKTLDVHIFCEGSILKKGKGKRPSNKVYDRDRILAQQKAEEEEKQKEARKQLQKKEGR